MFNCIGNSCITIYYGIDTISYKCYGRSHSLWIIGVYPD